MSVHYKFKSALEYDTVTFDGLHISVKDLKTAIIQQKRIGKSTDFDLQVTNAQTKEVYDDENTLIPKNTSLLIARIPVTVQKQKQWEGYGGDNTPPAKLDEGGPIAKAVDLSCLDAPEDDKIKAMMSQSTQEYDPSNYLKIRGANQMGAVPPNYKCYKCHQGGHWIKDCTLGLGSDPIEIKKSTGIPKSFMVPVDGPQVPGAMMTPNGMYAVPLLDHQAYNHKVTPAPVQEPKPEIPEDLICNICSDLLTDAVMIPCCGNSFCDECIRGVLLESEEHECPDCHDKDISPDTLIPNRFIRTSVAKFKNTTGYVKKPVYREPKYLGKTKIAAEKSHTPPLEPESSIKSETEQKTVISEADSTEHSKSNNNVDFSKDIDLIEPSKNTEEGSTPEGPPGVSPRNSPKDQHIHRISNSRDSKEHSSRHTKHKDESPRRSSHHRRSPHYESRLHEERSATPTIDEPTAGGNFGSSPNYNSAPPGTVTSMIGHIPTMQGPPQTIPNTYQIPGQPIGTFPPTQGPPPPNFRLPPPGTAPPPYMPPGSYAIPPRPMFEGNRPPIGGLPPNFNPNFPPGSRSHRDFNRRIRERTPPGLIDDPLAAFNRMLREKDEQKRRAKRLRRSYSRSRSRSRSFSRSPIRRRSRSPRPLNRRSRSRSRSFSLSRSRSRSFSGSRRGSPYRPPSPRRLSPPPSRRLPPRYRSPPPSLQSSQRSPPPRSRQQNDRHRDRDYDDDRDYNRGDSRRSRNVRDRHSRERDRDRYYEKYEDRGAAPPSRSQQPAWQSRTIPDNYYPPSVPQGYPTNRFPQGPNRDYVAAPYNQPFPQTIHSIQPPQQRQYQDIRPPGVDDDLAPPGVDEPPPKPIETKESPKREERDKHDKRSTERRERERSSDRKRRYEKRSRTPDKARNPSPKRKSKDRDTPEKHRRRRRDSSDDREKRVDHSDEEKSRKSKDKKKHKERKETEKKKKRERKDKHKKDVKEKKVKEEFKQVIPKKSNDNTEDDGDQTAINNEVVENRKEDKRNEIRSDKKNLVNKAEKQSLVEEKPTEDIPKEELPESPLKLELKSDLYGDISEDIDTNVIETYGKINDCFTLSLENNDAAELEDTIEDGEIKEFDEDEKDVLELHTNDIDLKAELDKSDILAPVPEKSKWEVEDDIQTSPKDSQKSDSKSDKSGKVTNEVLKRAENAIFAKAINAIRPIEIKKISLDRAKLYSGEREEEIKIQPTVASTAVEVKKEIQQPPRLSVKERLGVKVDDPDKIINLTGRNRSKTMSPFSRRGESGRNFGVGERRVEVDELKGRDRNSGSRSHRRDHSRDRRKLDVRHQSRPESQRIERKKDVKKEEKKHEDTRKSKRKLSRSRSNSDDRKDKHRKKEKKLKREKSKKGKDEDSDEKVDKEEKEGKPAATTKRKPTIDEANFEPDYDLESHTEEEDDKDKKNKKHSDDMKKSSSSESETESSSEEDRKKKKHKKRKKKKRKETSSSSSSESESDSSDSDRDRRRKKHKKNKKKKKKSKHRS